MTFIDLAGLQALVDAAKNLGDQRELVLGPIPDHVNQLMRLIGWHTSSGPPDRRPDFLQSLRLRRLGVR